ncbi:MAG: hypothetical protein JW967_01655 [Dehalococcoidales bacterium]|nr:hypothetical protein [Dehalococcoidales bacterium]
MNAIKQKAGLATKEKYGIEYYRHIGKIGGKLGGRPQRHTALENLILAVQDEPEIEAATSGNDLRSLIRAVQNKYGDRLGPHPVPVSNRRQNVG